MKDPWRSITEGIIREMVINAYDLALRYGSNPLESILAVVEDAARSGFGLSRILQMGWPDEIATIMDALYEDLGDALDRERIETDSLRRWLDGNPVDGDGVSRVSVLHPADDDAL